MIENIKEILYQNKAEDISVYQNVRYDNHTYIVASCLISKHVKAIAEYIVKAIKHDHQYTVEGLNEGNWVLVDLGNIVIHIFIESARTYYNVDDLWKSLSIT